jgi:hypothetical protein
VELSAIYHNTSQIVEWYNPGLSTRLDKNAGGRGWIPRLRDLLCFLLHYFCAVMVDSSDAMFLAPGWEGE